MEGKENLNNILSEAIGSQMEFNKVCAKTYNKLSKAAQVPELAKALDPEQTGIDNHIGRLKLLTKLLGGSAGKQSLIFTFNPLKLSKNKANEQDIQIIQTALQLLAIQNIQYDFILKLIQLLQLAHAPELIEQCMSENQDTQVWISRTRSHLLQP
ncbi:DUF892 family protein [Pedobacter polaris]|uniref:DUF892 family protein n=1 Tax=Pedobacter polaris TaxID=2571273 RepID=A0A4U1CQG8_9SPHI|nr:DUF892 family protein [Pedobacter polaris]TKC09883.1 DUF892 family protein [Pedobacter polaris]